MISFYENKNILEEQLKIVNPEEKDFVKIALILKGDPDAAIYFYDSNNNPAWLTVLKENGEFRGLDKLDDIGPLERVKAQYLAKMAKEKPKEVLDVITNIEARDYYVIQCYFEAILNMPEDELVNSVQAVYKYIDQPLDWWWCGHKAVELMVKLVDKNLDKAFEIACKLTVIYKVTEEKKKYSIGEAESKFNRHDYRDLLFNYYSKLWEKNANRASILLIDVFDGYMDSLDNKYDVEAGYNHILENLEKPGELYSDYIITIIIQAICKAGKVLIVKQPDKIKDILDYLENKRKPIFERIVMYLLRFVPPGTEVDRINLILGDNNSLKRKPEIKEYWYEYRLLLRDKFEEVNNIIKKQFEEWIKSLNEKEDIENWNEWYEKHHKDKNREEFLKQYESREQARELYLVRERYPELFKSILHEAGFEENDAAPQPSMWTPSHEEVHGVPEISTDDPLWDEPNKAIDFLITKKEWNLKKKGWGHDSPEEEQAQIFREVLQAKFEGYFAVDPEKIARLPELFLSRYMNCLWVSVREKEGVALEWQRILLLGQILIRDHFPDTRYKHIFGDYLRALDEYYDDKKLKENIIKENIERFIEVIRQFVKYEQQLKGTADEENMVMVLESGKLPDPFHASLNRLPSSAIQLLIRSGLIAKKRDESYFNKNIKTALLEDLRWSIFNIADYKILCVYGVWLPQLWYLDNAFFDEFVGRIFELPQKGKEYWQETWDAVWGTYMSWGRTSPTVFRVFKDKGIYTYAIKKINDEDRFKRTQKSPAEGLTEHLMIAYFNGWIEYEDELLVEYFETASVDLRAKAADFLTTGFETANKGDTTEKQKDALIAKRYWEERLKVISSDIVANFKEAVEFTAWVENSLLTPRDTFLLLEQTLQLTNGRVSERGDLVRFVKSVCGISEGYELSAIRCLNKATVNEYFATYHSMFKVELSSLMNHIVALDDTYNQVHDIWKEAVVFADTLGRLKIYEYEDIYKQLSVRLNSAEK